MQEMKRPIILGSACRFEQRRALPLMLATFEYLNETAVRRVNRPGYYSDQFSWTEATKTSMETELVLAIPATLWISMERGLHAMYLTCFAWARIVEKNYSNILQIRLPSQTTIRTGNRIFRNSKCPRDYHIGE